MFDCSLCSKSYRVRNSLVRHLHNHKHSGIHICRSCGLEFRRKDILDRHALIHNAHTTLKEPSVVSSRQRCQRACVRCRVQRSKCEKTRPCRACLTAGCECRDEYRPRRFAGGVVVDEQVHDNEKHDAVVNLLADSRRADASPDRDMQTPPPADGDIDHTSLVLQPNEASNLLTQNTQIPPSSGLGGATFDRPFDRISPTTWSILPDWPWTHESLFLQNHVASRDSNGLDDFGLTRSRPRLADQYCDAANPVNHALGINCAAYGNDRRIQAKVVQQIVMEALSSTAEYEPQQSYWALISERITGAFSLSDSEFKNSGHHLLEFWIQKYLQQFQPLWPLFWRQDFDASKLHPLLYLVITSIGSMYDCPAAALYGSAMHIELRNALLLLQPNIEQTELETLDIGRALLLTQVAALYFEHQNAFTIARRLAGSLVTHAHRIGLFHQKFKSTYPDPLLVLGARDPNITATWFNEWIIDQTRKRLAFGILRAETFMCVLLNTRPMVSYEEFRIELPASSSLWAGEQRTPQQQLYAVCQQQSPCKGLRYSDLLCIALDRHETLPTLLPHEHELLLFGLQHAIWRFASDPDILSRMCKDPDFSPSSTDAEQDHINYTRRIMQDLRKDRERVLAALQKWQAMSTSTQLICKHSLDRTVCLSGIVLYHLSVIRLCAPMETLQQAAYQTSHVQPVQQDAWDNMLAWANSTNGESAVQHACSIWSTIERETNRDEAKRSRFNIVALIGLFQAGVVVWAYAGYHQSSTHILDGSDPEDGSARFAAELCAGNLHKVLSTFTKLLPKITPAWGMRASFSKILTKLAERPFPPAVQRAS